MTESEQITDDGGGPEGSADISDSTRDTIVMVGLMGAGKTSIGRRLATRLGLPFVDADDAIEEAAKSSISDIFERLGEESFRDGERRVIARLLDDSPIVLATGGGAFMDPDTRALIAAKGISIWLRADIDTLVRRTSRREDRPLLKNGDPRKILTNLMNLRYPIYAQADITVDSLDGPAEETLQQVLDALEAYRTAEKT
ncbi:MAG: shikimate kinase [Alphaproteobacteria bacterium]|nr:shikimate kinase [Alphaproteobacteria bacterium]